LFELDTFFSVTSRLWAAGGWVGSSFQRQHVHDRLFATYCTRQLTHQRFICWQC